MAKKQLSGYKRYTFKREVLQRDKFTCQNCGMHSIIPGFFDVNHIKSKAEFPELAYDVNNGETLCPNCHRIITLVKDQFDSTK